MHNEFKPDVRATWNGGGNEASNTDPDGILKNYIWPQQTTNTYTFTNFCQYRLPCGYCERLMRDCPKWRPDNTPHLNKVDCATNTESVPQSGSLTTAQNACGGWKDEE